jgi:hypothetical protein
VLPRGGTAGRSPRHTADYKGCSHQWKAKDLAKRKTVTCMYPDREAQLQLQVTLPAPIEDAVWAGYINVEIQHTTDSQEILEGPCTPSFMHQRFRVLDSRRTRRLKHGSPGQATPKPPIVPAIWAKFNSISHMLKYSQKNLKRLSLQSRRDRACDGARKWHLLTTNQVVHTITKLFMMTDPTFAKVGPAPH